MAASDRATLPFDLLTPTLGHPLEIHYLRSPAERATLGFIAALEP